MNNQLNFYSPSTNLCLEMVQNQSCLFYYSPCTKCISMVVYQKNYDQSKPRQQDMVVSNNKDQEQQQQQFLKELQFKKYLLLDRSFNIVQKVQKKQQIVNYSVEYDKIMDKILKERVIYWNLQNFQINFQVCAKKYICFKNCNDFHFGRHLFVRKHNSFQIKSELISRDHCRIVLQQGFHNPTNSHIKYILKHKSQKYSIINKITNQLWNKIEQYLFKKDEYHIVDTGSRNGTFVKICKSKQNLKLKQNFSYQFDHCDYNEYYLKVWRMKETLYTQSILQHNQIFFQLITQFKDNQLYFQYQKISKTMLVSKQVAKNIQTDFFKNTKAWKQKMYFQKHKLNLVIFLIQFFNQYKQFYCVVTQSTFDQHFDIGIHHEIDTSRNLFSDLNILQGRVFQQKGKWWIADSYGLKGKLNKIWIKIPSKQNYKLNVQKDYVLRLAHSYFVQLKFLNFKNELVQRE